MESPYLREEVVDDWCVVTKGEEGGGGDVLNNSKPMTSRGRDIKGEVTRTDRALYQNSNVEPGII